MLTLIKHPLERIRYGMEFASLLEVGETLTGPVDVTVERSDQQPSDLVIETPVVAGSQVQLWVSLGVNRLTYRFMVCCDTSFGNTRVGVGDLFVTTFLL
jgi:hypothetical protein